MTALQKILENYRHQAETEREQGTYFEKLIRAYLCHEATYADLYSDVWLFGDWARSYPEFGISARDTGIDLVARTRGSDDYHAIQCKCYAEDYRLQKKDIDSFFTASGRKPFSHRVIVATTDNWTDNAEAALFNQQPPVTRIDLHDLETSQIDWARYQPNQAPVLRPRYDPRAHQKTAIHQVVRGLQQADRGKLIMACGTGKTFVGLKIAERMAGKGKRVLFLVPGLSLLSQTLTEWTQQSKTPLHSFAVCSDSEVGKKRKKNDDTVQTFVHELRYPATTRADKLAAEFAKRHDDAHLSVVFSTYHSIDVISKAQKQHGLADFDLIICDEAHRTTGSKFAGEDESHFVKVHDADFIKADKRLYMTATPRIFADSAKIREAQGEVALFSMDDERHYGRELHVINFSEAVARNLLCDYKVIVLNIDEDHVNRRLQSLLADENNSLKVDDAAKIVGCWKALAKQDLAQDIDKDTRPMRRAVAFCQVIEATGKVRGTHKVSSKQIAAMFRAVVESYRQAEAEQGHDRGGPHCEAAHIDGHMNAGKKEAQISWLKADTPENTCRVLSNVRCLSEGVDVPALDAVLFLSPRNSQVDVVQSVGRVMRKAAGKKLGYVILPVVIPAGMKPHEALDDNKTYKVVWEVLQALRSHDDRFDAMINKLDLIGRDHKKMEVIAITDKVQKRGQERSRNKKQGGGKDRYNIGETDTDAPLTKQVEAQFEIGEIERGLYARVVKKCGNRNYWSEWAGDIARIARTHISRIRAIVGAEANVKEVTAFRGFADELRDDLNDSISDDEVIEMLAQHLITRPVFDALFAGYSFAAHNPVAQAMQSVLDRLQAHRLDKETDTLQRFYDSVKLRAADINNAAGKQKIILELYDKFFRNAFPRMTERLGIVYTPVEVVDFIIHSVNDLLQREFGQTLGSAGVHILDPFAGTGTFITRLLQSGLISKAQLPHKYRHEIHCNELVLLAYYIAAINIEAVYHAVLNDGKTVTGQDYRPFTGICLTDTFQLYEKDDLISALLVDNSDRRKRQKQLDIRVIIGNPPYSIGQRSENDNAENIAYPGLDTRIRETYAARSAAALAKGLYDSYIRAIRWASDRIGDRGVIGFVSGSGFIEKPAMDGMRKCLADEFSDIYIFNLRGDIRKNMLSKGRAREGENIFGSASMTGIAISFLVKNPNAESRGKIHYLDTGDELNREQKLEKIGDRASVAGITAAGGWRKISPDRHGDWLNQRDDRFDRYLVLGDKKGGEAGLFDNFSLGIVTNRDAWCYNHAAGTVAANMNNMIGFYNRELERFNTQHPRLETGQRRALADGFIDPDPARISWTRALKKDLIHNRRFEFDRACITQSLYRPFNKQYLYFNRSFNEMVYQIPRLFPQGDRTENRVMEISGIGARSGFSVLVTDLIPNLHLLDTGQCFPLYLYEKNDADLPDAAATADCFAGRPGEDIAGAYTRKDGISAAGLAHFQRAYPGATISKEDIFYYVYGLLHSPDYRTRYANNLSKQLPRIPCVKSAEDFRRFAQAGRELAELHIHYDAAEKYPVTLDCGCQHIDRLDAERFYVTKMKHPKVKTAAGKRVNDRSTVIYNAFITVRDIPPEAYDYVVNGKAALDWVIERQAVIRDKKSGIVNDANTWAIETMHNPRYPLELLQRVITVSLETLRIVKALPAPELD